MINLRRPEMVRFALAASSLFQNEYFTLRCHADVGVVEIVRSQLPLPAPSLMGSAFAPMLRLLDDLGRERHCLLLDSRDAVPNNDPAYEASFARFRNDLHRGFRRIAVLVRTPAGNLQALRLVPNVDTPVRVFQDREQAWAFVTTDNSEQSGVVRRSSDAPSSAGRWR